VQFLANLVIPPFLADELNFNTIEMVGASHTNIGVKLAVVCSLQNKDIDYFVTFVIKN
jgi:hypothetical protein